MKTVLSLLFLLFSLQEASALITWSTTPTTISTPGVDATDVQVGIDGNGNAVAIWLENGFVKASNLPLGGSWSALSTLSNTGASSLQIVVDSFGNATAIWNESGAIKTSMQPFGSSWGTATSFISTGGSDPQISVATSGDLVAIWVASGAIQSSTKPFGGSWSTTPDVLASTGADSPQVSIGSSGVVFAVWHAVNPISSMDAIYSSFKTISGTWSTATAVSNASQDCAYPQIGVDGFGNGLAVWYRYTLVGSQYTNVILQSSKYEASGFTWSAPVDISEIGLINPADLQSTVVISPIGNGMAVWLNSVDGSTYSLSSAFLSMNGFWSGLTNISSDPYCYSFELDVDQSSNVYLSYMKYNYSNSTITIENSVSILDGISQNFWTPGQTLSVANQNGYADTAVMSGAFTNNGVVTWVSYNGTNQTVQALTGSGTPLQPPSNLSVSQSEVNYGLVQQYNNTISWDASPSPTVGIYLIYRNGVSVNQVYPPTLSFVDLNAVADGAVTYSIASVNPNTGEVSSFVSVNYP